MMSFIDPLFIIAVFIIVYLLVIDLICWIIGRFKNVARVVVNFIKVSVTRATKSLLRKVTNLFGSSSYYTPQYYTTATSGTVSNTTSFGTFSNISSSANFKQNIKNNQVKPGTVVASNKPVQLTVVDLTTNEVNKTNKKTKLFSVSLNNNNVKNTDK